MAILLTIIIVLMLCHWYPRLTTGLFMLVAFIGFMGSKAHADICKHVDLSTGYSQYSVCKTAKETRIGTPPPIEHNEHYYVPQLSQSDLADRQQKLANAIERGERQYQAMQSCLEWARIGADAARVHNIYSHYPTIHNFIFYRTGSYYRGYR